MDDTLSYLSITLNARIKSIIRIAGEKGGGHRSTNKDVWVLETQMSGATAAQHSGDGDAEEPQQSKLQLLEVSVMEHNGDERSLSATSSQMDATLDLIRRDPSVYRLDFKRAPTKDEVARLQQCLRFSPHVQRVGFSKLTNKRDMERWLGALSPQIGVDVSGAVMSQSFAAQLTITNPEEIQCYGAPRDLLEAHASKLLHLDWERGQQSDLPEGDEQDVCALLPAAAQVPCLSLAHSVLSAEAILVLSEALSKSSTLTALEIWSNRFSYLEKKNDLDPLWAGLQSSRTCALQRLTIRGSVQKFTLLETFLASAHARTQLVELRVLDCWRHSAELILPAIAENCACLTILQLEFEGYTSPPSNAVFAHTKKSSLLSSAFAMVESDAFKAAMGAIEQQATKAERRQLSSFSFGVGHDGVSARPDERLFGAFLSLTASANPDMHSLNVNLGSRNGIVRFHAALRDMLSSVRVLELEFGRRDSSARRSEAMVLHAIAMNQRLESLTLAVVDESVAMRLIPWLTNDAPSTLTNLSLTLDCVTHGYMARLIDACVNRALVHLSITDGTLEFDHRDDHSVCHAAVIRLLEATPSLQTLHLEAACSAPAERHDDPKADTNAMVMRKRILEHPLLERTNLLTPSFREADEAVLDARRLRRHRLAGHWAQLAVATAFARNHHHALHGSVLPILPTIAALAGLVLPAQGWAQGVTRTSYFACASGEYLKQDASRKRKRS